MKQTFENIQKTEDGLNQGIDSSRKVPEKETLLDQARAEIDEYLKNGDDFTWQQQNKAILKKIEAANRLKTFGTSAEIISNLESLSEDEKDKIEDASAPYESRVILFYLKALEEKTN